MDSKLSLVILALASFVGPAFSGTSEYRARGSGDLGAIQLAQSNPERDDRSSSQRSARTAEREQALAELDDPDRIGRIGALEDILDGKDAVLIDFAIRKVFVGTDGELKALALRKIISKPDRAFIFTITSCSANLGWSEEAQADLCRNRTNLLSGAVRLYFDNMDPGSGQFMVHATYSRQLMPGKVQGTKVNFAVDLAQRASQDCFGTTTLSPDGALVGTLSCDGVVFSGRIDLL